MKIIVDAMGGDNAPMAPVEASVRAVKELDVEIVLTITAVKCCFLKICQIKDGKL